MIVNQMKFSPLLWNSSIFSTWVNKGFISANFSVSVIGRGAFTRSLSLTEANFPECITIGSSAFLDCFSLT